MPLTNCIILKMCTDACSKAIDDLRSYQLRQYGEPLRIELQRGSHTSRCASTLEWMTVVASFLVLVIRNVRAHSFELSRARHAQARGREMISSHEAQCVDRKRSDTGLKSGWSEKSSL
jgi:hypothetical protein